MKSIFKPLIAGVVVAAVVASALYCCCVGKLAQTYSSKIASSAPSCHGNQSSSQKDAKPCNCSIAKVAIADTVQLSTAIASSLSNGLHFDSAAIDLDQRYRIVLLKAVYGGAPPGQLRSVPLYLQNRSLRL